MERDCLIAYGASMLLLERLMISSDEFTARALSSGAHLSCAFPAVGHLCHALLSPHHCMQLVAEDSIGKHQQLCST